MDDDILMVNMGSWYTVAHMSILTNNNTSKIFVCGIQSQDKDPEMKKLFTKMGCQSMWKYYLMIIVLKIRNIKSVWIYYVFVI